MKLELKNLPEDQFMSIFEACGDSEPFGLVLDGQVIGLVNVRFDVTAQAKLLEYGIGVNLL